MLRQAVRLWFEVSIVCVSACQNRDASRDKVLRLHGLL